MKIVTAKDLKVAITRHESVEELCGKYNLTREEFYAAVKSAVGGNQKKADGLIADVERSAKKQSGRKDGYKDDALTVVVNDIMSEGQQDQDQIVEETEESGVAESEEEMLVKERTEKSGVLCQLEVEFYKYRDKRLGIQKDLRQLQVEMTELATSYKAKQSTFESKLEEFNALKAPMTKISEEHLALQIELDELDEKIQALRTITVLVIDGELVSEKPDFVADFTGAEEIYRDLLERTEEEFDLKKSQLALLSRVIASKQNEPNLIFEFDSDELERAYKSFR